jgi:hypothetical protein
MNGASAGVAARKVNSRAEVRGWSDIGEIEMATALYNDGVEENVWSVPRRRDAAKGSLNRFPKKKVQ